MANLRVITPSRAEAVLGESVVEEFASRLRGELLCPGDPGYEEARLVWNDLIDKRPALIARCAGVRDVIDSVTFARENDLLVAVRGGGHNVAGNAVCDGGLVKDLSPMKRIRVDPERRTVRAQGGTTWADLDRETQVFGLATPGGEVSETGIAGLTLGGAISRVTEDATAYGNRNAQFNLSIDSTWEDPTESERNLAWTREVWTKMRQFSDGGIYLNFAGFLEVGEKLLHEARGENYERLVALKTKYDPTNLFRLNHNLKPTVPEA